jgi:CIC family chloride channel protein
MREKGDFTADPTLIEVSAMALLIGAVCAFVAVSLMWLIGIFTNLFFYHQLATTFRSPAEARTPELWELGTEVQA